jgi:hypothetical protein
VEVPVRTNDHARGRVATTAKLGLIARIQGSAIEGGRTERIVAERGVRRPVTGGSGDRCAQRSAITVAAVVLHHQPMLEAGGLARSSTGLAGCGIAATTAAALFFHSRKWPDLRHRRDPTAPGSPIASAAETLQTEQIGQPASAKRRSLPVRQNPHQARDCGPSDPATMPVVASAPAEPCRRLAGIPVPPPSLSTAASTPISPAAQLVAPVAIHRSRRRLVSRQTNSPDCWRAAIRCSAMVTSPRRAYFTSARQRGEMLRRRSD